MSYKAYMINDTGLINLENWFHMVLRDYDIFAKKRLSIYKEKQFYGDFEVGAAPSISVDYRFTTTGKDEDYRFASHEMTEVFVETTCLKLV